MSRSSDIVMPLRPLSPRHLPQRLACAPVPPWSARHSQQGCQGARGAGAAPFPPCGAAPTPNIAEVVGTVGASCENGVPLPAARRATAVLATFEGQVVFRLLESNLPDLRAGDLFRLRKGSRIHAPRGPGS